MIPEGQEKDPSSLPELTITGLNKLEFFAVTYVEKARITQALVVRDITGALYLAPQGDQWIRGMRPLSDKMTANVERQIQAIEGPPIKELSLKDSVDIIAEEIAQDEPTATA